jgi:hypothetical protein
VRDLAVLVRLETAAILVGSTASESVILVGIDLIGFDGKFLAVGNMSSMLYY